MSEPRRPQADPSPQHNQAGRAVRRLRLNWKAAAALVAAAAVAGLSYLVVVRLVNRNIRSQLLEGARASTRAGNVDQAIRNLQRYLDAQPNDLPVIEELARISVDSARGPGEASAAAAINDRLLRLDPGGPGRQETRRRLVDLYVRLGDWHRASSIYRLAPEAASYDLRYRAAEAIARDLIRRGESRPDESRPGDHRLLAMALEGLAVPGNVDALKGSVLEYERALRGDPADPVAAERLARLCLERLGDPDRGLKVLDGLIAARPSSSQARLIRYRYFLKLRRNDLAQAELEQATRLAGSDLEVRLTAASDAIRRGDGPGARRHLDAIPEAQRSDLRVRVTRGMVDFNEERPDEAIDGWRQGLLTIGGTDAELTWWLAHALLQMGRVAEARPLVAQYRRLSGDDTEPLYRFLQAELDEKTGRPTRAIIALEWARDRIGDAWQATVHMALGRCYEAIWDEARALAAYRRANQIDPRLAEPRIAASRLLGRKPEEAALEIERGVAQSPDDPSLRIALVGARLRQQVARPPADRSWREFDRALALARQTTPNNSSLLLMQADRMALGGDLAGAIALLERGTGLAPRNSSIWIAWAEGLKRRGDPAGALRVLERGSDPKAAGDRASIRIARAQILLALGRGREARDAMARDERALPLSDRAPLHEALGRINAARGDVAGARASYAEWARILPDDPRPRLALLELAEATGDEASVRSTVAILREIGGPEDIAWRLSRVQELLWTRTETGRPLSRRDPLLDEASRIVQGVLVDAPEIPAAHLLRGQILEKQDRLEEAAVAYRRAWERGASPALPRLVDALTRLRRFDDLAGLKLILPSVQLDQLSALASYRAGDIEAAVRFIDQAAQDGEKVAGTQAWRAQMLETIGRRDQSEEALRAIAEQRPAELDPWLALIRSLAAHGKAPEARATIERARTLVKVASRDFAEASFHWAAGDRAAADRAFRAAIADRPSDVEILITAARYFEETGRRDEGIAALKAALKAAPRERGVLRQLAILLALDPQHWDEGAALIGLEDSAGDEPADRLGRALVISLAPDPAKKGRAVAVLEALIEDLPLGNMIGSAARSQLTRLLLDSGQLDRATQVAVISAETGTDPEAMGLYIECLLRGKKSTEALRQIARLEAIKPGDPAAAAYRVRWVREDAGPGGAAKALERAVRDRGEGPEAEAFGRAAFASIVASEPRALDEAEGIARALVKSRPSASWMAAKVAGRRGKPAEALALCAPSIESANADDRKGAAEVATDVGSAVDAADADRTRAAEILEAARSLAPRDYKILVMSGMLGHAMGRFEDEAGFYRAALEIRPGDPLASNNLAWVLSESLGHPEQALPLLDDVIARKGRLDWILDTRGVVLSRLGRHDEAIQDLKDSGGDHPSPASLFRLARACRKANRDQEFRDALDRARRSGISPDQVDATERAELTSLLTP